MSDERDFYVDSQPFSDLAMNWEMACSLCFSDSDFYERTIAEAHPIVRDKVREWYDDEDTILRYLYAPAEKVRRRMGFQGYTVKSCRELWEREYARHIVRAEELKDAGHSDLNEEIEAQKGLTFEKWTDRHEQLGLGHMLRWGGVHLFNFNDMFADLALTIDVYKPEAVWTDFTSTYDEFDPNLSLHANLSLQPHDSDLDFIKTTGNVLILTEGTSDTKILSSAIRAIYPEYADMYEFVDFDEFKVEGGASMVTKMVKTFAGVRMTQRIIALFDNDVAGLEQIGILDRSVCLPPSFRVMALPDVPVGNDYPTIGPEGLRAMNVNGSACSIELFLGLEALKDDRGQLRPIRWKSWNKSAKLYQGALEDKGDATKSFLAAMKAGGDPHALRARFSEMDGLLNSIFRAFD